MAKKEKRVYFDPEKKGFEDEKKCAKTLIDLEADLCTDMELLDLVYQLLHKARMQKESNQTETEKS